jgi:hypothetical protein
VWSRVEATPLGPVVLRAFAYAVALALLALYAPSEGHVFIYQGF